jgi:hypothetical protein
MYVKKKNDQLHVSLLYIYIKKPQQIKYFFVVHLYYIITALYRIFATLYILYTYIVEWFCVIYYYKKIKFLILVVFY